MNAICEARCRNHGVLIYDSYWSTAATEAAVHSSGGAHCRAAVTVTGILTRKQWANLSPDYKLVRNKQRLVLVLDRDNATILIPVQIVP